MPYFLAYDMGTSSVKAVLVDEKGNIMANAIGEYPLYMPHPGWVEQIPSDYWSAVCVTTRKMVEETKVDLHQIKGIIFSTQAMGIIPVTQDGEVLYPNITWVDGRAETQAKKAMNKFLGKSVFKAIVGIEITGKDVIPKLMWLKEVKPEIFDKTYKFLDVNGYMKYRCTGRMVAEWSGACSYAFDLKKKDWERIFFKLTGIGTEKLPDLVKSTDLVGGLTEIAAQEMGLIPGIAVYGGCDDTQSAAVGTTAIGEGEAHIYTGTSAWVGISTAKYPKFKNGAVCLQSANPEQNLVVGITESAGANTDWLIKTFYLTEKQQMTEKELFAYIEEEAKSAPPGCDQLIVTPWFLGERCPVSTTTTRSTVFNMTHDHTRGHVVRAHFEGIAYNLRWALENMEKDFGFKVTQIKATGGGTHNDTWMQIIANITGREVLVASEPKMAGALGVAICAMIGSGTIQKFSDIHQIITIKQRFQPDLKDRKLYDNNYQTYKKLYSTLKHLYLEVNGEKFAINE